FAFFDASFHCIPYFFIIAFPLVMNKWCILILFLLSINIGYSQRPRFKAAAFYSTKGEMDHINFARDALYFFTLTAEQQDFTFDATTDWTNLNDDYLANYDVVIWLNDFPQTDEQRQAFERYINR